MPVTLLSPSNTAEVAQKPVKLPLQPLADQGNGRFQSPVVQPQMASLNTAVAAQGFGLHQMLDTLAVVGLIKTIGQPPANSEYSGSNAVAANAPKAHVSQHTYELALQKVNSLSAQSNAQALPISSLSELAIAYPAANRSEVSIPVLSSGQRLSLTQSTVPEINFIDLSLMPLGTPVAISQLPNAQVNLTVIDGAASAVRISDFKLAQSLPDSFINTNLATLNLAIPTPSTILSASIGPERTVLNLSDSIEISTGITVSGTADGSSITLLLNGDRANLQTASMSTIGLSSASLAVEMNAIAGNVSMEFTPFFLAELSNAPAGELQIRLIGAVAIADTDIVSGTLILGG